MIGAKPTPRRDWVSAWPDALAFVIGLGLAWRLQWQTTDLVWSLWLSSLCVGYAMIVWSLFRPAVRTVWRKHRGGDSVMTVAGAGGQYFLGALFLLGFFTVHFGMFHFVHSIFLMAFFPIQTETRGMPGVALYAEVLVRYGWWLPAAFLAERQAFRWSDPPVVTTNGMAGPGPTSSPALGGADMMAPYRNVVRMHLLIFFFAFASFAKFDSFAIYAAVYAVYFFPWRLVFPAKILQR